MKKINEKNTTRTEEDTHRTDLPLYPGSKSDTRVRPDSGATTSTPRWVKVFVIIALVIILLFVILHLTGNSFSHGGHMSYGLDKHTSLIEHGVL